MHQSLNDMFYYNIYQGIFHYSFVHMSNQHKLQRKRKKTAQ